MIFTSNDFNNKINAYFNIDNNYDDELYAGTHTYTYLRDFDIVERNTYYDIYVDKVTNTVTTDAYGIDIGAYNDNQEITTYHLHLSKSDGHLSAAEYSESEMLKYFEDMFRDAKIDDGTDYYYNDEYSHYIITPLNTNRENRNADLFRDLLFLEYYPKIDRIVLCEKNKNNTSKVNITDYCKGNDDSKEHLVKTIKGMIDKCFHKEYGNATYEDIFNKHKKEFLEDFEQEYTI